MAPGREQPKEQTVTTLDGRVVIITGAGRGIGREHALLFAQEGASLVINDLGGTNDGEGSDVTPAEEVAAEARALGTQAVANTDDVSTWAGAERMVQSAISVFGDLDVVVNNAGILRDRYLANMTEAEWDAVIAVHLKGHFAPSRGCVLARRAPSWAREAPQPRAHIEHVRPV
jgi:NAD(P)-dependent dehydrogenase (short-subunit alcohol dehydrogenase family)